MRLQNDMFACGSSGLPISIVCNGSAYRLEAVFKHDFFACTGRYISHETTERIVLKLSRIQPFCGIPLRWLGHFLRNRELKLLSLLQDIDVVPKELYPFGSNGLIYRYIEGHSLDEKPEIPDQFFNELKHLLKLLHDKNICYMDLNKRGNILLGTDKHPHLIDFQISLYLPGKCLGFLRTAFQKEDVYHLLKHKRRFRPDLMTQEERIHSRHISWLIRLHRFISHPFRQGRRWFLRMLYLKNILKRQVSDTRTPENNPSRFLK